MHPSLRIYNEEISHFVNTGFSLETIANDCRFTEGPLWNGEGYYLFSDTTANTIYKVGADQKKQIFIASSGTENTADEDLNPDQAGSNALAYTPDGLLLVCQHGNHQVAKWEDNGLQPFINSYEGKPLNSPNDVIVASDGRIFFSDPPYGLKKGQLNPGRYQPLAAVYCWDNGELKIVCDKYQYPNGVCITPDGKELYICSNKPFEKFISVYDAQTLQYKKVLANENSDGIKCDPAGHVYLCTKEGIVILSSEGARLALIQLSTVPSNICWGGKNLKDLFITARENVFLIPNLIK